MSITIDKSITKPEFLLSLWYGTSQVGYGFMCMETPTLQNATDELVSNEYVGYFYGKPIKTFFGDHPIYETYPYDIDAGDGRMEKITNMLVFNKRCANTPKKKLTEEEKEQIRRRCSVYSVFSYVKEQDREICMEAVKL
jgi:hypothetical protein